MPCEYCGMYPPYHSSACPRYSGVSPEFGHPIGKCCECGQYIYEDDDYSRDSGYLYCSDCMKQDDDDEDDIEDTIDIVRDLAEEAVDRDIKEREEK